MFTIIIAALLGLLVGMIASVLGIGGGVLLVPLLHILLGLNMHESVGTSLFVVVFLASSAAISYYREKLTLWKLTLIFECGSVPGAYVGAFTSYMAPSSLLRMSFSILLLYISTRMWRGRKASGNAGKTITEKDLKIGELRTILLLVLLGFVAGFLSGLLGIGGGVVKVPIMSLLFGIPIHNSVATSALMVAITTLTGSATHLIMGGVRYDVGLWLVPSVVLGAHLGTRISVRLKSIILSRIFSILLALIAVRMIIGA